MGLSMTNIRTPKTFVNINEGAASVEDWLFVNPFIGLSPGGSWTVEVWAGTDDGDSEFNRIVDMALGGGGHAYSLFVKDGIAGLQVTTAAGDVFVQGGPQIADGDGHHIAGVYDSVAGDLILYVDGEEVARAFNVATPSTSSFPLNIGRGVNPNEFFDGGIAEVRVWSTALTQADLKQFAVDLEPGLQTDLQVYVGFEDGIAVDVSNSNAGVFSNGNPVPDSLFLFHAGTPDVLQVQDGVPSAAPFIAVQTDLGDVTYMFSSSDGTFKLPDLFLLTDISGDGTGNLSFKGSLADVNTSLAGTTFNPNPGFTGTTTIDFSIHDAGGLIESAEIVAIVAPSNSVVNTAMDVVDDTDGVLSLREAIGFINDDTSTAPITFDPTVFNGESQDIIRLTQGEIEILKSATINGDIDGDGTPDVMISGDANGDDITDPFGITDVDASRAGTDLMADNSRIFHDTDTVPVEIIGLSLTGGQHINGDGGAVRSDSSGLLIQDSVIEGNIAMRGGAVFGPNVNLNNTDILNNRTTEEVSSFADGGGLFLSGTSIIEDSLIAGNRTDGVGTWGGGLYAGGTSITIRNSEFRDNSGSNTGGAAKIDSSSVTIVGSLFESNQTSGNGGGLWSFQSANIANSTFSGNTAYGQGGGIYASNSVNGVNLTVSGNQSYGQGGGIRAFNVDLDHSTVSGNSTTGPGGYGGGIFAGNSLTLQDSIVLGNEAQGVAGTDEVNPSAFTFNGLNIIGADAAAFDAGLYATVINANPADVFAQTAYAAGSNTVFGVLADNGGGVPTIALNTNYTNPALDAAQGALPSDVYDVDGDGNTSEYLPTDARGPGYVREFAKGYGAPIADLGAFEAQGTIGLVVNSADDSFDLFDDKITLREAVHMVNTNQLSGTITFDGTVFNGELQDTIRLQSNLLIDNVADLSIDGDIDGDGTPDVIISGDSLGNDTLDSNGLTDIGASYGAGQLSDNNLLLVANNPSFTTTLNGLIFTGAYNGTYVNGGAIHSQAASTFISNTVVSGNMTRHVYQYGGGIYTASTLTITDSTVSNNMTMNDGAGGGGIATIGGDLTIIGSTISGNSANGQYSDGGGIYNSGSTTIVNSTIDNNSANDVGGGVFVNGPLLTLVNATITGNEVLVGDGGGVAGYGNVSATNATLTGNTAGQGGGGIFASGALYSHNSIILSNTVSLGSLTGSEVAAGGGVFFYGGNLVGASGTTFGASIYLAVSNADPTQVFAATTGSGAGVLADNGGAVQTVALLPDFANPAVDGGYAALPPDHFDLDSDGDFSEPLPTDARGKGFARDIDLDGFSTPDIGAFEVQPTVLSLVVDTAEDSVNGLDSLTSLREAVSYVNLGLLSGTVTFDPTVFNGEAQDVIRLTRGHIEITESVSIDGDLNNDGIADVMITGDAMGNDITDAYGITDVYYSATSSSYGYSVGGPGSLILPPIGPGPGPGVINTLLSDNSRIFYVSNPYADTNLTGLTLTGGRTGGSGYGPGDPQYAGGAIKSRGDLTIADSYLAGNSTGGDYAAGGAVFAFRDLTVTNSTFDQNSTIGQASGGGAIFGQGSVDIGDSVLNNNETFGEYSSGGALHAKGSLIITDSKIHNNSTDQFGSSGGGIFGSDNISIVGSDVYSNDAHGDLSSGGGGGGVAASSYSSTLTITGSTITDNQALGVYAGGGGVYARGDLNVVDSTISGNATYGDYGRGGGINSAGTTLITGSTVSENATFGQGADGGGAYFSGDASIISSTIDGNRADGTDANGGGIAIGNDHLYLLNSTISNNELNGNYLTAQFGGGIAGNGGGNSVTAVNSTIANNSVKNGYIGGITVGRVDLVQSTVTGNNASAGVGGAFQPAILT
jgi:hypothetical protein